MPFFFVNWPLGEQQNQWREWEDSPRGCCRPQLTARHSARQKKLCTKGETIQSKCIWSLHTMAFHLLSVGLANRHNNEYNVNITASKLCSTSEVSLKKEIGCQSLPIIPALWCEYSSFTSMDGLCFYSSTLAHCPVHQELTFSRLMGLITFW